MNRFVVVVIVLALVACRQRHPAMAPPDPRAVFGGPTPSRANVRLATDEGIVHCLIEPSRTPVAAAMFVGFARGGVDWRDPRTGATSRLPVYRDLAFHRRIRDVLVQSGCPLGNGTGQPGFRVPLEVTTMDAERLSLPGALLMATYTPPPMRADPEPPPPGHVVGSQFVIALGSMRHLAGHVTVLGHCDDLEVIRRLSARADRPTLRTVEVEVVAPRP